MKKLIITTMFVSSTAFAGDFETMYARFADDFAKLRAHSTVKVDMDVPVIGNVPIVTIPIERDETEIKRVDPKSPDRLGLTLSDPVKREKMKQLYNDPNIVVLSTTVR
jgi:hypothetical protein